MKVEESYGAVPFAANGTGVINGAQGIALGGFLCTASGTLKLTKDTGGGATIVDTLAVTAGAFIPIPLTLGPGFSVFATLAGNAAGTFFVN